MCWRGMERKESEDVVVSFEGRVEIDTSAPFRSVKEAIVLFGERVLAGEVYAAQLNQMRAAEGKKSLGSAKESNDFEFASITAELQQTKQCLEKAREESLVKEHYLSSLKEELDTTKRELEQLKGKESDKRFVETDDEDLKFVENSKDIVIERSTSNGGLMMDLQRKRSVKFASPPSLARVITMENPMLHRQSSLNGERKKKKSLFPFIGGLFSKKKKNQSEIASANVRII